MKENTMIRKTLTMAGCILAMTIGPAYAASSTATAPLRVTTGNGIWCGATNAGTKPIEITVEMLNESGVVVSSHGPVTVAPGATASGPAAVSGSYGFLYCRVNGFSPKKVHVTTCLVSALTIINGSGECLAITTAP